GNPCGGNPCAGNPCGGGNPCAGNPCGGGNPCAGNPCGGGNPCAAAHTPDFSGWKGWTKVNAARFVSKGHRSAWVDVYVDSAAVADKYNAKSGPYPVGARIAKVQYKSADDTTPVAITAMVKMAAGYDDENGNWWYGVYDASGTKAMKAGKIDMCINCHDQASDRDYVFGPK
ncbi:MAG: hypothetical protein D6689_08740, partial [Deltaproteobacteria bacterium]